MSAFGYFGSKKRIGAQLVALLPPHATWVELFAGSAAITLAKPRAAVEVINDTNPEIINFYRQLQGQPNALLRALTLTPYARQEFKESHVTTGCSPLESARRFYVRSMMSINGAAGTAKGGFSYTNSYSRDGREGRVSRWISAVAGLKSIADRLKSVRIEHRDALDLFTSFALQPDALVYLDPPYLGARAAAYDFDANDSAFHAKMLGAAVQAQCMVLISGYEHPLYDEFLTPASGWIKLVIDSHTRGNDGKNHARKEILWMNRALVAAKKCSSAGSRLHENLALSSVSTPDD